MNRRGYLYVTGNRERILNFKQAVEEGAALGAGPLRCHSGRPGDPGYTPASSLGFEDQPSGIEFVLDPEVIRRHFPYLSPGVAALIHARRCGWFSVQQLGMYMLEQARRRGFGSYLPG